MFRSSFVICWDHKSRCSFLRRSMNETPILRCYLFLSLSSVSRTTVSEPAENCVPVWFLSRSRPNKNSKLLLGRRSPLNVRRGRIVQYFRYHSAVLSLSFQQTPDDHLRSTACFRYSRWYDRSVAHTRCCRLQAYAVPTEVLDRLLGPVRVAIDHSCRL